MKIWSFIAIVGMVLITGACSDSFIITKDGYGYFVGSSSQAMYEMICVSGDMKRVLSDTQLGKEMKDNLYRYSCSSERSNDKVKLVYASMTPEERKDIKSAFRKNGFTINALMC